MGAGGMQLPRSPAKRLYESVPTGEVQSWTLPWLTRTTPVSQARMTAAAGVRLES